MTAQERQARTAAASRPAIRVQGLVKRYGAIEAVRGIDLEVRSGEVFGYVGPNGAGKSTTIRCLLDLIRPTIGSIEVLGQDPRHAGVDIRRSIGYVPGELRLPERMTSGSWSTRSAGYAAAWTRRGSGRSPIACGSNSTVRHVTSRRAIGARSRCSWPLRRSPTS